MVDIGYYCRKLRRNCRHILIFCIALSLSFGPIWGIEVTAKAREFPLTLDTVTQWRHTPPIEILGVFKGKRRITRYRELQDLSGATLRFRNASTRPIVLAEFQLTTRRPTNNRVYRFYRLGLYGKECRPADGNCGEPIAPGEAASLTLRKETLEAIAKDLPRVTERYPQHGDARLNLRLHLYRVLYQDGGAWQGGAEAVEVTKGAFSAVHRNIKSGSPEMVELLARAARGEIYANIVAQKGEAFAKAAYVAPPTSTCSAAKEPTRKNDDAVFAVAKTKPRLLNDPCLELPGLYGDNPNFLCYRGGSAFNSCWDCADDRNDNGCWWITSFGSNYQLPCGYNAQYGFYCYLPFAVGCSGSQDVFGNPCEHYEVGLQPCGYVSWQCGACVQEVPGVGNVACGSISGGENPGSKWCMYPSTYFETGCSPEAGCF